MRIEDFDLGKIKQIAPIAAGLMAGLVTAGVAIVIAVERVQVAEAALEQYKTGVDTDCRACEELLERQRRLDAKDAALLRRTPVDLGNEPTLDSENMGRARPGER